MSTLDQTGVMMGAASPAAGSGAQVTRSNVTGS